MKKKTPLVTPVTIETITKDDIESMSSNEIYDIFQALLKEIYPYSQLTYDVRKCFDYIHIRNVAIRYAYNVIERYQCEHCGKKCTYNKRIKDLVNEWFSSPQNVERIITNNTDK